VDSSRQRIAEPESGIWTPDRGRRRRTPTGPPLCSTTFGGSTIPPLFGGGGGAASAIFLRSTSAWWNKDLDGNPFLIVPGARNVNDSLFCLKAGFGQILAAPAGWTALPAYANGYLQIYTRLATNTAADNFLTAETSGRNVVGQIAAFGNTLAEVTQLVIYQGGALNNNNGGGGILTYEVFQLPAGPFRANNLVLGWWMRERNFGSSAPPNSMVQPQLLTNDVSSIAFNSFPSVGRLWVGWEWEAEAGVSPQIPPGGAVTNITYLPLTDFSVTTAQMQRLEY